MPCTPLADYFMTQMCGRTAQAGGGLALQTIEVLFPGISFAELQRVTGALETEEGVQGIRKSLTGEVGRLQVEYRGGAEELATLLTNLRNPRLEIVGFAATKLEAKVVK